MRARMMREWKTVKIVCSYCSFSDRLLTRLTGDDYVDYDSDYEAKSGPVKDVDPYAGMFTLYFILILVSIYVQVSSSPRSAERK
jgi:hypothetical protein